MFVRIARFEGVDGSQIDAQAAELKRQIDAARAGEAPAEVAELADKMRGVVSRFYQLADREKGVTLGMTVCDSEDDVRAADAALNEMTPPGGGGHRASVEIYEVVLDESFE